MDVLLTLLVLKLPSVTSSLQTCSSGTETSSNQLILDVSSAQREETCSCRLTVSQTAQVEMFPIGWSQQCDTYMTIQKMKTSTLCTNGVVQTPTLSKTVTTGEEIWILVVAARPGARLLFKLNKSSSDKLSLECFEPNTNGSTTNTPSPTTQTTQPMTTTADAITSLLTTTKGWTRPKPNTTNTPSTTQTTQPMTTTGAIFAAGIATGGGVAIIVQVIYFFIIKPRCRTSCRKSPADFPVSEDHPMYAGFSNRATTMMYLVLHRSSPTPTRMNNRYNLQCVLLLLTLTSCSKLLLTFF